MINQQEIKLAGTERSPARLVDEDGKCLALVYLTEEGAVGDLPRVRRLRDDWSHAGMHASA